MFQIIFWSRTVLCSLHCTRHCQPSFSTVGPIYFRVPSKMHLQLNSVKFVTSYLSTLISLISTSQTTCQVEHHLSTRWEREEGRLPWPDRPKSGSCSPRQPLGFLGAQRRGCFQTLFWVYLVALQQQKYLNIWLLFLQILTSSRLSTRHFEIPIKN